MNQDRLCGRLFFSLLSFDSRSPYQWKKNKPSEYFVLNGGKFVAEIGCSVLTSAWLCVDCRPSPVSSSAPLGLNTRSV